MENMELYNKFRKCPDTALRQITAGRLKGKSDINPMWRIKTLTEAFGSVGIGWYYDITKQWIEPGANGEVAAFVNIDLFVKVEGEWSKPIKGTGGAMFVTNESKGAYTDDEAYKKALTDAISVSCKALGIAADVYWDKDNTKYPTTPQPAPKKINKATVTTLEGLIAETQSDREKLLAFYKVSKLEDMTDEQAKHCYAALNKKKNG